MVKINIGDRSVLLGNHPTYHVSLASMLTLQVTFCTLSADARTCYSPPASKVANQTNSETAESTYVLKVIK
jgi:hypothetical protein